MLDRENTPIKKFDYRSSCAFYLGAIVTTLVCQLIAALISAGAEKGGAHLTDNGDFNTAFMIAVQVFNAAYIFVFKKAMKRKFDFSLFRHEETGENVKPSTFIVPVIAAAALMAGMYLPTVWYGYFTEYVLTIPPETGNIELTTASSMAMMVLASVLFAPVCEETIYRGVLFKGLKNKYSPLVAALLSALAFMLMHMSPVQVVFQFALGFVSAFMIWRSGRLLPSMIFHASSNALALVISFTPLSGALAGCEIWLTQNIAAAFFITLALAAASGGVLYVLIRYGFDIEARIKGKRTAGNTAHDTSEQTPQSENISDENTAVVENDEVKKMLDRSGTHMYLLAIGICAVVFVASLVILAVS